MKRDFGHCVVDMDGQLRVVLRSALEDKPFPASLLGRADADPVSPPLLAVLDRYGRSGRFYYLDKLTSNPQGEESPTDLQNQVEGAVLAREPAIKQAYSAAQDPYDHGAFEASISRLSGALADSLVAWWEAICGAGRSGAYGDDAGTMGFEIHPDSVPPEMNSYRS